MRKRNRKPTQMGWQDEKGTGGPSYLPTNLITGSHPEFPGLLNDARSSGRQGDPDPTKSTLAPACFFALRQMCLDQLNHRVGLLVADIEGDRVLIAGCFAAAEADEDTHGERAERRRIRIAEANERISSRKQRCRTDLASIIAVWSRMDAEMQQVFRRFYPYSGHVSKLIFPTLSLNDINFGDDDLGFGGTLAPTRPHPDMWPPGVERRALSSASSKELGS